MGLRSIRRVSRAFTLACFAVAVYAGLIEPRWLQVTRHATSVHGETLRLVHLTDLHTRGLGLLERRVIEQVSAADPDVVLITGDIVAGMRGASIAATELADVRAVLARLSARIGVFAVPGNWEHWRGFQDPAVLVHGTRVTMLRNSAVEIRAGLWLVGLDDACGGAPDEAAAFREVPPGATVLAMMHSPAPFPSLAARASLVFAGHSHGGQVRFPFLPPLWLPPQTNGFVAGWYEHAASRMYVSRGVGTSILPLRFFCRPEVAVIDVRPH